MKTLINLLPLVFTVLFAVAIGGVRCPLYTREEIEVKERKKELRTVYVRINKMLKTNGLWKFIIADEPVYAVTMQAAATKYARKRQAIQARVVRRELVQYVALTIEV